MMQSEFEYLDSACEMTVLPQPKAPGTAQVPPSTDGKRASMTRWPVRSGDEPASFSATGRGVRTGQYCCIVCDVSTPSNLVLQITSSIVYSPLPAM